MPSQTTRLPPHRGDRTVKPNLPHIHTLHGRWYVRTPRGSCFSFVSWAQMFRLWWKVVIPPTTHTTTHTTDLSDILPPDPPEFPDYYHPPRGITLHGNFGRATQL